MPTVPQSKYAVISCLDYSKFLPFTLLSVLKGATRVILLNHKSNHFTLLLKPLQCLDISLRGTHKSAKLIEWLGTSTWVIWLPVNSSPCFSPTGLPSSFIKADTLHFRASHLLVPLQKGSSSDTHMTNSLFFLKSLLTTPFPNAICPFHLAFPIHSTQLYFIPRKTSTCNLLFYTYFSTICLPSLLSTRKITYTRVRVEEKGGMNKQITDDF